jgi:hypothetical protein
MAKFFYGDCGQLIGCDDPTFDLSAEQDRRRALEFERDLTKAIKTGKYLWSSGSSLGGDTKDALWAVASEYPNPAPETIEAAKAQYRLYLESIDIS